MRWKKISLLFIHVRLFFSVFYLGFGVLDPCILIILLKARRTARLGRKKSETQIEFVWIVVVVPLFSDSLLFGVFDP